MARILVIGIATLDIINSVEGYPREDDKLRAVSQRVSLGGNAANTLIVLSQLGHEVALGGMLANDAEGRRIEAALHDYGVATGPCCIEAGAASPTSYITHNIHNGSRTIIHHRELREFSYDDFQRLALQGFDWIHFEGRNVDDCRQMLAHVKTHHPAIRCSLEIEKPRDGIVSLLAYPDVLLFSRDYVVGQTESAAPDFLSKMHDDYPQADLMCAWGAGGAYGLAKTGMACHQPAYPPVKLVDTLAAGDTFNAAVIDAYLEGDGFSDIINKACRLAGRKCGHMGLDFIKPRLQ